MKLFITEFAENKKEIERSLKPSVEPIIEHLFKLHLMPNHESVNHWRREIYSFLYNIDKLKGTNKYPSSKQIYDWTFGKIADKFDDNYYAEGIVETIEYDYNVTVNEDITVIRKSMYTICKFYFSWISNELSIRGIVTPKQVYVELDKIF